MKIVVWSPTTFAGRKSANLLLLALQAMEESGREQLVIHVDPEGSGPEHFLLSGHHRRRMMERKEFGLEFLCRLLYCERFTKEAVRNASYTFFEEKLNILPAGSREFYEGNETMEVVLNLIQAARREFQNIWIEVPAGNFSKNEKFFRDADCILVNLAQSPWEAEKLSKLPMFEKAFYIMGAYEPRNIYSVGNMMLLYPGIRGKCGAIPYYPAFSEACCAGELERFWTRKGRESGETVYPFFFREVQRLYKKWKEGCERRICGESGDEIQTDRSL